MSTTAIVAVASVISTPVVAIAGYVFNERRSRDDRKATRELAERQREHETRLRRGERAYSDRRKTYVELLEHAMIITEHVDATEPLITYENAPEPPEYPSPDVWRDLQARVSAYGSPEVGDAADAFYAKARSFFAAASVYRSVLEQPTAGDFGDAAEQMTTARIEVGAAFKQLQTLVRDDLANL